MNDKTSTPSRLLRFTAVTARWMLGLLVAAWLLFGLSVAVLHGWIVPRIGQYRGVLQAQVSRVIGVPVRIGSVTAQSRGLFPVLELRDVVLLDPAGREALRLARVVASVSPRSVFGLSFEQLYLEQPQVDVRRDAAGRLHVAGLDLSADTRGDNGERALDWFFSQREFVIEGGTVRWIDEQRGTGPLLLTAVRLVVRNGGRLHAMRLDFTPPAGWGQPVSLRARLRQPLLSVRQGNWRTWSGPAYAELPDVDVSQLGRYATLDARIGEGRGGLRLWADVQDGAVTGVTADLALTRLNVRFGEQLAPLVLSDVTGRVAGQRRGQAIEVSTQRLQFQTDDGLRWPGGNLWLQHAPQQGRVPEHGAFKADRLDLAALALIAGRLPLGEPTRKLLDAYAPRGLVERIDASWQGPVDAPERYQARGRVSGLQMAAQPAAAPVPAPVPAASSPGMARSRPPIGQPGLRGATVDFDASQTGGKATLAIAQGALEFPGVFEEPLIPVTQLNGQLQWQIRGPQLQVQLNELSFANADAQGTARLGWHTSDAAGGRARFPGVLDLQGTLTRADGARVFRYLPLDIPKTVRDYVRDAVTHGSASTVDFRVRGDLRDMPFTDPRRGEFRIAARVADVNFAYVPHEPGNPHAPSRWPALTGLAGDLLFERAGMQVLNARGRVAGAPGLELTHGEAQIADMGHPQALLQVDAQARGPVADVLKASAPLLPDAKDFIAGVRASGSADYRLKLDLPLAAPDKARVQVGVALGGNDVQLLPQAPAFQNARGALNFTETGFTLAGVQGRLAGGDTRLEGRGRYAAGAPPDMSFSAQGTFTAEGLRGARELPWLTRLAQKASGGSNYAASFSLRGGASEFLLTSGLQGLGLQLPPPLAKTAGETLALRIEKKVVLREARAGAAPLLNDQLNLELGRTASAQYVRDLSGEVPRVLRGSIGIGLAAGESAPMPERGVLANVNLPTVDVDAWEALLGGVPNPAVPAASGSGSEAAAGDDALAYLPTSLAMRAQDLRFGGRQLHKVVIGGTREGTLWRANVDATELSGYVEYRQAQAGRILARLARLRIERSEAPQVESLLDSQPSTLPALDVVVDDFNLLGHPLGRLEIEAVNRGGAERVWQLNKLAIANPAASFSAQGSWAAPAGAGGGVDGPGNAAGTERRRTDIDFKLDIADAGALLGRLGMPGVLSRGRGLMQGQVAWRGSPFSLDYPSMSGQIHVDLASGQFLKADPGLAKLLGVLSLQALPRRLTLDFRDVFSTGFAFDIIRGDAGMNAGTLSTNNLQMKGVNAVVLMDGAANLVKETQDLHVVVVPQLNADAAALVATAINPAIGIGTFLAQRVLSRPLIAATTQEFHVDGTWADPRVTRLPRAVAPKGENATPATTAGEPKKETTQ